MIDKQSYHSSLPLRAKKVGVLLFLIFSIHLAIADFWLHAQSSDQKLSIRYHNNLLTISAKDADLSNVLIKLAEMTDIYFSIPVALHKKVTIRKNGISIKEALQFLLRGLNHAIIYSGPSKNRVAISEVFIFKKAKTPQQVTGSEIQIANRIKAYQRQIETLKMTLSKIDENSSQGRGYLRAIKVLEKNIERLEQQLN